MVVLPLATNDAGHGAVVEAILAITEIPVQGTTPIKVPDVIENTRVPVIARIVYIRITIDVIVNEKESENVQIVDHHHHRHHLYVDLTAISM